MLEILVYASIGRIPAAQAYVVADVPDSVFVERRDAQSRPASWESDDPSTARRFGDQWLREGRSAVLVVPSVVARFECNALINPLHADARRLQVALSQKVIWDQRLFARPGA